jgi:hypothetical protein
MLLVSCAEEDPIEPETDPKDKFIGTWNVKEEIAGQVTGNYPSVVTSDTSNTSKIVIGNIYNLGTAVKIKALVVNNSLDISLQTITGVNIVGTGTNSGSGYILNYTADDGSGAQTVKATYTK